MRTIISLMHISLDGFAAGPNGEMDWIVYDDEIFQAVSHQLSTVDTALYGRVTYQMMESYWPTVPTNPESTALERHHADWVEKVNKIVFSKTLPAVTWNNTRLIREDIGAEIARLKAAPGQDMMNFGSPRLVHSLLQLNLIDEYRLTVSPVVLGQGTPYFAKIQNQLSLKLVNAKVYQSGVVGLHYRRD